MRLPDEEPPEDWVERWMREEYNSDPEYVIVAEPPNMRKLKDWITRLEERADERRTVWPPGKTISGSMTIEVSPSLFEGYLDFDAIIENDLRAAAANDLRPEDVPCPFHADKALYWCELNGKWQCPTCDREDRGSERFPGIKRYDLTSHWGSPGASCAPFWYMGLSTSTKDKVPRIRDLFPQMSTKLERFEYFRSTAKPRGRASLRRIAKRRALSDKLMLREPRRRAKVAWRVLSHPDEFDETYEEDDDW